MMTLILATFLTAPAQTSPVAQFRPCVWPNKCASTTPLVSAVPVTTCVWPNICG